MEGEEGHTLARIQMSIWVSALPDRGDARGGAPFRAPPVTLKYPWQTGMPTGYTQYEQKVLSPPAD